MHSFSFTKMLLSFLDNSITDELYAVGLKFEDPQKALFRQNWFISTFAIAKEEPMHLETFLRERRTRIIWELSRGTLLCWEVFEEKKVEQNSYGAQLPRTNKANQKVDPGDVAKRLMVRKGPISSSPLLYVKGAVEAYGWIKFFFQIHKEILYEGT